MNVLEMPVEALIPHSPPMVLLDRIIQESPDQLTAEVTISADSRFFDPSINGVAGWVGIEYMACAIAALAGIRALRQGEEIKLGFLLGSRKYEMPVSVFTNEHCYQINVRQLYMDDSGLASFDCSIVEGEQLCVSAKLSVFETDDASKVLEKA